MWCRNPALERSARTCCSATVIRPARREDLAALQDVERAAGALFRSAGMDVVADDDPLSIEQLALFQTAGRAWVVADEADRPVAYLVVGVVNGTAHIEQVSVAPAHGRRGLGRRLIETAAAWAVDQRLDELTLTTFADVPWNRPYYERLGFRVLTDDEMPEGLRRIRLQEKARGLDAWPRVCMSRPARDSCGERRASGIPSDPKGTERPPEGDSS